MKKNFAMTTLWLVHLKKNILTRFGVYRDEYDKIQEVTFDNIEVSYYK
jgi:hypothetical protein